MAWADLANTYAKNSLARLAEDQRRIAHLRTLVQQEVDSLEQQEATRQQRVLRAASFNSDEGICPRCFIDHGERSELRPIASALTVFGAASGMMLCPNCKWTA